MNELRRVRGIQSPDWLTSTPKNKWRTWAIYLEDGDLFNTYVTKKQAVADAKKYGLKLANYIYS